MEIENCGLSILSYFFLPFLQQERDRKEWMKKQANDNKEYQ